MLACPLRRIFAATGTCKGKCNPATAAASFPSLGLCLAGKGRVLSLSLRSCVVPRLPFLVACSRPHCFCFASLLPASHPAAPGEEPGVWSLCIAVAPGSSDETQIGDPHFSAISSK